MPSPRPLSALFPVHGTGRRAGALPRCMSCAEKRVRMRGKNMPASSSGRTFRRAVPRPRHAVRSWKYGRYREISDSQTGQESASCTGRACPSVSARNIPEPPPERCAPVPALSVPPRPCPPSFFHRGLGPVPEVPAPCPPPAGAFRKPSGHSPRAKRFPPLRLPTQFPQCRVGVDFP